MSITMCSSNQDPRFLALLTGSIIEEKMWLINCCQLWFKPLKICSFFLQLNLMLSLNDRNIKIHKSVDYSKARSNIIIKLTPRHWRDECYHPVDRSQILTQLAWKALTDRVNKCIHYFNWRSVSLMIVFICKIMIIFAPPWF